MRKSGSLLFVLVLTSMLCSAQVAVRGYSLKLRVQYKDTAVFCDCPQEDHGQDQGGQADCNTLSGVMVNIYSDTILLHTFYTNETGYIPWFDMPDGKYKLVFRAKNYTDANLLVDFSANDKRNVVTPLTKNSIHYKNDGTGYFICVILEGKGNTHGVRIVPKKG
jgi:hypothetical protein